MRVCNIACKIDCYISNDYIKFFIESIEDLNKRLAADSDPNSCVQIDARNFRPNIVVSGVPAFDEVLFEILNSNLSIQRHKFFREENTLFAMYFGRKFVCGVNSKLIKPKKINN